MRRLKPFPVRRYVFCQNHYYAFHGLADARSYADAGIDTVFCCSEVIAAFLTGTMGLDRAPVIHNAIDPALFRPAPKRRLTAVMPRQMKTEGRFLRGRLQRRPPNAAHGPWSEHSGTPTAGAPRILDRRTGG